MQLLIRIIGLIWDALSKLDTAFSISKWGLWKTLGGLMTTVLTLFSGYLAKIEEQSIALVFLSCFAALVLSILLFFFIVPRCFSWVRIKIDTLKKKEALQTQQPSACVERITLVEFLKIAEKSGVRFIDPNSQLPIFFRKIKQAAFDGEINFWGRPNKNHMFEELQKQEILKPIPADHWENFIIDGLTCIQHQALTAIKDDNSSTSSYIPATYEKGYTDIHLDKQQSIKWLKSQNGFDK